MIAAVLKWMGANPLALALATLLAFSGVQTWRLGNAHDTIDALNIANAGYKAAIDTQNAAIDGLSAAAEAKMQAAQSILDEAKKQAVVREERASTIINRPVPTKDAECAAALDLLREFQK